VLFRPWAWIQYVRKAFLRFAVIVGVIASLVKSFQRVILDGRIIAATPAGNNG
jgi:hypothetical protein